TLGDGASASGEGGAGSDGGPSVCTTTRISYGNGWIHGASHTAQYDDADGLVTWDGKCTPDGANSYAVLSNGFKPYFAGHDACVIALDTKGSCAGLAPKCTTRIAYGDSWSAPAGHTNRYDDVDGRVFASGTCANDGASSHELLSNGFNPYFTGNAACSLSLSYAQCGGLYTNPVIPVDCPDPGVLYDSGTYYLSCTSGNAGNAFPIYTSPDLVHWTNKGSILPSAAKPAWAQSDFWAPEIHKVGTHFVAYFSARNTDGVLSVGAASAASPLGPYKALTSPLIHDANMGLIDVSEFNDSDGTAYVLWKEDGNAKGVSTPIHTQKLAADGLSRTGAISTLITNDEGWEGALVEGPFMIAHGGMYYLFYSANGYASTSYAVGVARASKPTGPFTKLGAPIVTSDGAWSGPGHCSVVDTPGGDTYMIYHAWYAGKVGASPGRVDLTDQLVWANGWPSMPFGPSASTRPLP
ncbi:MAG: glycoside hydrolase family 43 protein, partial [Polyangiaceae bacterium]